MRPNALPRTGWISTCLLANDRVLPFSAIGIAAIAVGGAGIAGGIVWKVSEGGESDEAPSARLEILPTRVRVRGNF